METNDTKIKKAFEDVENLEKKCLGGDEKEENIGLWLETLQDLSSSKVISFGACKTVLDFLPSDLRQKAIKLLEEDKLKLDVRYTKHLTNVGSLEACSFLPLIDQMSGILKETKIGDKDLGVWRPRNATEGWCWLGHYAQPHKTSDIKGEAIIIKPLVETAVAPPRDYNKVWSYNLGNLSKLGNSRTCISCWKIIPPEGYCALGFLMLFDKEGEGTRPSDEETKNLVCVRQDLVERARIDDNAIWKSQVTRQFVHRKEVSLWSIVPYNKQTAHNSGTFFVQEGHDKPHNPEVWCLKKNSDLIRVISS